MVELVLSHHEPKAYNEHTLLPLYPPSLKIIIEILDCNLLPLGKVSSHHQTIMRTNAKIPYIRSQNFVISGLHVQQLLYLFTNTLITILHVSFSNYFVCHL